MKIVAVGECTVDRYVDLGVTRVGGISLNFAISARLAGVDQVAIVSCTGSDPAGARIRAVARDAGIDVSNLHSLEGATASQAIHLLAGGERHFPVGGYDAGVLADYRLQGPDWTLLRRADVIAVAYFRQLVHLFEPILHADDLPGTRVVDLLDGADLGVDLTGIESMLDTFAIMFISGDEGVVERLLPYSRWSRSLIVVTHGAGGSSALVGGAWHRVAADPVAPDERIDTTGCGDAFQAAFTIEYYRSRDIHASLRAAAHRAAQVIRHLGATSNAS